MKRWVVNETPSSSEFREFELAFPLTPNSWMKKYLRLFPDGHIELGAKKSPFQIEYKTEVHQ